MIKKNPILSVVVITYGHEEYLEKCLESIFSQETVFDFEVIISNDNSPDNSHNIVTRFIESHRKDKITVRYIHHTENLGMTRNFKWVLEQSKGKYIAYCEGDDYWIDKNKLQNQVEFLESNSEYTLTCGGHVTSLGENKNLCNNDKEALGFSFDIKEAINKWLAKSLTICFRNFDDLVPFLDKFQYSRDVHLIYFLLSKGKGYYFNRLFGYYNIHNGGVISMKSKKQKIQVAFDVFDEFYSKEKSELLRKKRLGYLILVKKNKLKKVRLLKNFESFSDLILLFKIYLLG